MCETSNTNFTYIKKIVDRLYSKHIVVYNKEEGYWQPIKWIEDYKINEKEILLKFHERMGKLLLNLLEQKNYTQTVLSTYFKFHIKYSHILYDYCRSFIYLTYKNKVSEVERTLTINELRDMIGLNIKSKDGKVKYPLFGELKKHVLDPSFEEINEYSDIRVCYEVIKKGRKVDSLKFKIRVRDIAERFRAEALSERNKK